MPTPSPIIAASIGAKLAMSKMWVPRVTRPMPTPSANRAVRIGRPIATTEPKVRSRTTIAAARSDREGGVPAFFLGRFLDQLTAELDLQAVARRCLGGGDDFFRLGFVELVVGDVELHRGVSDLAVLADRARAFGVRALHFADVRELRDLGEDAFHLRLDRFRGDPCRCLEDDRRALARLLGEAVFEQVKRFHRVGGGQVEFFGEFGTRRAGEDPDPNQGHDPADDHGLAVAGGPGGEASHRASHRSELGGSTPPVRVLQPDS